jgi:hypothetical protein
MPGELQSVGRLKNYAAMRRKCMGSVPASGAVLVQKSAAPLQITDDMPGPAGNPTDDGRDFVRRHYQDFLNREPAAVERRAGRHAADRNAGGVLTDADKAQLEGVFGGPAAPTTDESKRAQVLRAMAENAALQQRESNRAFVLMQYFGYLRRAPDDAPDADHTGYDFWLQKLDQFNGDFVQAEMVKAFLSSTEYRQRFSQP